MKDGKPPEPVQPVEHRKRDAARTAVMRPFAAQTDPVRDRQCPPARTSTIESSNRTYMTMPRTVGLTRSPPGVTAAEKIAIPRITKRLDRDSRAELMIPTFERMTRMIGNSIVRPNARKSVPTKP